MIRSMKKGAAVTLSALYPPGQSFKASAPQVPEDNSLMPNLETPFQND